MVENVRKFARVGVLLGGYSKERDISCKSGHAILASLKRSGVDAIEIDITSSDIKVIRQQIQEAQISLAFIALHGVLGEDGQIQSILESLNIDYTGTAVQASQITIDKSRTQNLLKNNGIRIANYVNLVKGQSLDWETLIQEIGEPPYILKPVCEGSSIGISIVNNQNDYIRVIDDSWQYGDHFLIEQYIHGREMTVGILSGLPLGVIEVKPENSFFDFSAKYQKGKTVYDVPAKIDAALADTLRVTASQIYQLLDCRDFARVDFIVDNQNNHFTLEINTIPGFTETSLLPMAADLMGINFDELCIKILEMAYGRKKEKKYLSSSN